MPDTISIEQLQKENADLKSINEKLVDELEKRPAHSNTNDEGKPKSFSLDGKTHTFNFHKITHGGKSLTSQDVADSEELQRELVAIGSGMISETV